MNFYEKIGYSFGHARNLRVETRSYYAKPAQAGWIAPLNALGLRSLERA